MKKIICKIVALCFILSFSTSCSKKKEKQTDEWVGKQIYFPGTLYELKDKNCYPLEAFKEKTVNKKKVVSIIDATCKKCIIYQLNRIDSLFTTLLNENTAMVFVLNINKADSAYFISNLYPDIKANGLLLWDNAYHFETDNDIFTEKASRRTFLLDENNVILQVGNPLFEPQLLDSYKKLFSQK